MSAHVPLSAAQARDAADPLREFRAQFALPRAERGEPPVYLCGHSLGLLPLAARERVNEELDEWARLAVLGPRQGELRAQASQRIGGIARLRRCQRAWRAHALRSATGNSSGRLGTASPSSAGTCTCSR